MAMETGIYQSIAAHVVIPPITHSPLSFDVRCTRSFVTVSPRFTPVSSL